jgi:Protein of unknown function, DUF600
LEDDWGDIPQESWDDIVLSVSEEGQWSVEFDYTDEMGVEHHFDREEISWDQFLDIYDMAAVLDQEIEIEY